MKYGHLFKYDFNSQKFRDLLLEFKTLKEKYESLTTTFLERREKPFDVEEMSTRPFELMADFVNALRAEMESQNKPL